MRNSFLLLLIMISLCFADDSPQHVPDARVEHTQKKDTDGNVVAYIDTTYRGKVRSLQEVRFKKKDGAGWGMWRTYFVNGKGIMQEQDDADGKSQTISFFQDGIVCEMFRRHQDGSVEPVSSAELENFLANQQQFTNQLVKVLEKINERLQTNSPEQVMQYIKAAAQQAKQEQKN